MTEGPSRSSKDRVGLVAGRPEEVLRRLELDITRRLDGLLQGDYQGLLPGPGSEPGESRPYRVGDDVRRMDWNVTARTAVPHVRDAVADRELETWVLVDASASLDFGTAQSEKRDLVLAAVAAVGFLTARTGNRLGAVVAGAQGTFQIPARSGRAAMLALLHKLATIPHSALERPGQSGERGPERPDQSGERALERPGQSGYGGPTDLGAAMRRLLRPPRRRGMAVVVSDFISTPGWERPLRALGARHQVLAVEVIDPRELELPKVGYLTLVDPETGARRDVQTSSPKLRARFAEAAAAQRAEIGAAIRSAGAQHLVLRTDRDWMRDVVTFVSTARRRRGGMEWRA